MQHVREILLAALLLLAGCTLAQESVAPSPLPPTPNIAATCDELVSAALQSADQACAALGRNQACYGNHLVNVEFQQGLIGTFGKTGDIADLVSIRRLTTAPLDLAAQVWGVAVLKAQADLPDALPGQNVTFLLYGNTTIDNLNPQMRAVRVRTSVSSTTCASAPESAVLIQSPEGTQAALNINGADVTLGSTLYLTAEDGAEMTIATIEGTAVVSAFNTTRVAQAGAQVRLALGGADNLQVVGPPSEPEPFDVSQVSQAPLPLLERVVPVGAPISPSSSAITVAPPTRPPATAAVACVPRSDWTASYTIQRGDTLFSVARSYNLTAAQLQQANCLADPNRIQVGQSLRVPFVRATNTPLPATGPAATSAPSNPNLRADKTFLQPEECTAIRWDVANAKEVYFEGQPVAASSVQQVCPATSSTYRLLVVQTDGQQIPYTLRIEVALPQLPTLTEEVPR